MGTMQAIDGACNMCHQMPMITITIELGGMMPPCPDKEPTSIVDRDWSLDHGEQKPKKPSDVFKSLKGKSDESPDDGEDTNGNGEDNPDESPDEDEEDKQWPTKE